MAYNFANMRNPADSMLPIFNTMTNGNASNQPNFLNQLAAAIATCSSSAASNSQRDVPAPKLRPNQGTAPMDLEDAEAETTTAPEKSVDPNLFYNSLMSATSGGYMFFPTPANTAAATNSNSTAPASVATAGATSMLMDPMLAAAMQQMQQGYAAYAPMPESGVIDASSTDPYTATTPLKDVIKTKNCILFPPNPNAPPPTIRERPLGCRTIFVGGLPENITEDVIREIFESCGEITTLRMSKKNFCHIRYRHEASIDRAIYLSGYRVRISSASESANFGRLHVDYAQARDDQYDHECRQRQLQREERHRKSSLGRSQSPPPIPHYSDHEASLVAESLRSNETFVKAVQTICVWLERGDCIKRNANSFYSMIQSTHAHVRRLHTEKQQLEDDLRKARESYRRQMLTMSSQFTQIEKVFSAASHKKVWDHFTKAQRKNIDQWKKLATEMRSIQIEDDEMEMSDDDRDFQSSNSKKARYDSDNLKEENDSLRCQLEAARNEMFMERTDIKYTSDFREKQIKVLQETIRNMQTQLLQTRTREQNDTKTIEQLERRLKEAGVKQLLLKTKIKETTERLKDKEVSSVNSEASDLILAEDVATQDSSDNKSEERKKETQLGCQHECLQIIDIDVDKSDDEVRIIEDVTDIVEIQEDNNLTEILKNKEDQNEIQTQTKLNENVNDKYEITKVNKDVRSQHDEVNEKSKSIDLLMEGKIIALTSAYLVVQPFGAESNTICAYLNEFIWKSTIELEQLESLLLKYTNLFQAYHVDVLKASDTLTKWRFCGFKEEKLNE